MGLLKENDEGLGLMGQAMNQADLAGSGLSILAEAPLVAGTLLNALKKVFLCIPVMWVCVCVCVCVCAHACVRACVFISYFLPAAIRSVSVEENSVFHFWVN